MNDLQSKSDEELNAMLAECLGYSECRIVIIGEFEQAIGYPTKNALGYEVLRFTSSLDAIATVEAVLTDEQKFRFTCILAEVVLSTPEDPPDFTLSGYSTGSWAGIQKITRMLFASARQRTIALIATLQPKEPHE